MNSVARCGKPQKRLEQQAAQPGHNSWNLAGRSSLRRQELRRKADLCQRLLQHRLLLQRQRQSGSLFPWQRPAAPPAGSAVSSGGGSLRLSRPSIIVPDQRSFGSTSTRTFAISPAPVITATRKAGLYVRGGGSDFRYSRSDERAPSIRSGQFNVRRCHGEVAYRH
jgi:hypothetical protein